MKRTIMILALVAIGVGCAKKEEDQTLATNTCCQCPGVWNDPPTDPQTYRIPPDCENASPGEAQCEAHCISLGHTTGALAAGSCSDAPEGGQGKLCQ
jgi:hypothetical protein